jgi:hypothetical protein
VLWLLATDYKHIKQDKNIKPQKIQSTRKINEVLKLLNVRLIPSMEPKLLLQGRLRLQASSVGEYLLNTGMTPGNFRGKNPSKGRHWYRPNQWILTRTYTSIHGYPPCSYSSQAGLRGQEERGFNLMPPRRGLVPRVVGGITGNDQGTSFCKCPNHQPKTRTLSMNQTNLMLAQR